MSTLRFCAIAVVALLASAASATVSSDSCGTAPTAMLFGNSTTACTKANACQTTYCSCIGAAAGSTNFTCGAFTSSAPNCSVASTCVAAKIACINAAADDASSGCSMLKDLKMSNIGVAGGQIYNASAGFKACKYEACKMLNGTSSAVCPFDPAVVCASPIKFVASMVLRGNWAVFLADPTKKANLKSSFEKDLTRKMRFPCTVTNMYVKVNRRRATQQDLVVDFTVSGVSANNAELQSSLAAAKSDNSFLVSTLAVYQTENAGSSFTVRGIAAGSGSSAVFSYTNSASGSASGTSTTGTATTSTTGSASTSSSSSTTTGSTSQTTAASTSTTGSSGSTSGAATQSLLAAVVVAVIGALLF